jgi:ferritin-like metal-binding protein YciE
MTPRGGYRSALEQHLQETRSHAERVQRRLGELGEGGNPLAAGLGVVESLVGQVLALSKTPLDLLRGSGGEEKVLKNAKDACATEALEIATYTVLEHLARAVGDDKTARLAASIRADEEKMLARVTRELRPLTAAVVGAEVEGDPSYDVTTTGAADAARATARSANAKTRRTARQARKVPGVARVEGEIKGAVASAEDLAIARYDRLTAEEIAGRLPELSQIDLAKIDAYEREHQNRTTVLSRIDTLRGSEPWPGYDELGVQEIRIALDDADDDRVASVRAYERAQEPRRRSSTPPSASSPPPMRGRITSSECALDTWASAEQIAAVPPRWQNSDRARGGKPRPDGSRGPVVPAPRRSTSAAPKSSSSTGLRRGASVTRRHSKFDRAPLADCASPPIG